MCLFLSPRALLEKHKFMKSLGSKSFWNTAIMFTAILLCNIGAKWGIVDNYGSYSPNWDEWEAHGVHLLKPWIEGDFSVKNLLAATQRTQTHFTSFIGKRPVCDLLQGTTVLC